LHHDTLTGLPNRILFRDRLEQVLALAQRGGVQSFAVMHFGIDQFKTINQCFGYAGGNQMLLDITRRLELVMYEIDTVSRVGGDEFLILVHNIQDSQDASSIARKIIASMQQPLTLNGQDTFITASIGVAVYPDDGTLADELLKNANTAMYRSKEDFGRGNFQFFSPDMNSQTMQQLALENDLRHAIEHGEFHLHYQPQVDIENDSIIGVEALIRWNHPKKGNIPPAEFIPATENSGLIEPIGDWVLQTACQQHRDWINLGLPPVRVAVNLSARQFMRNNLVEKVAAALERFDMQACHLELELTESMLMHDVENTVKTLRELKLMGVRLSIDDFGTGYSSLSYLKRFPIDTLKVDRSFIKDLGTASDNGEIARAIIAMAHALGMEVVAEGVENQLQLDFVREFKCNIVQGYFFSKPLSPENFSTHMKDKLGSLHRCLI
jgi:diguanylate cyclase (GGDEF)-like protein